MEVELKLLIEPRHVDTLRQSPLLQQYAGAPPETLPMQDIYFDTPDLAILKSNAGLRVREAGGAWVQTLKGGGGVASGLHSRYEWESAVAGPQPDLGALAGLVDAHSAWGKLLRQPELASRLEQAFTTSIRRTTWDLRLPEGDLVEFALDEGSIACRGEETPVCEIEIELKSGQAEHLFDFALELIEQIPLRLGAISKAARGYALYQSQSQAPAIVRARPLRLARELNVEEGFRLIIANCLAQVQANEAAVTEGNDPEGIHQMRVGLRRLRSALRLFKDLAPCPQPLLDDLSWLGKELGEARDWEVLLDSTLPRIAKAVPEQTAPDLLQQAAEEARAGKTPASRGGGRLAALRQTGAGLRRLAGRRALAQWTASAAATQAGGAADEIFPQGAGARPGRHAAARPAPGACRCAGAAPPAHRRQKNPLRHRILPRAASAQARGALCGGAVGPAGCARLAQRRRRGRRLAGHAARAPAPPRRNWPARQVSRAAT